MENMETIEHCSDLDMNSAQRSFHIDLKPTHNIWLFLIAVNIAVLTHSSERWALNTVCDVYAESNCFWCPFR